MVLGLGPASQFHDAGVPSATPGAKPDDCCFFNFSKTWIANGGLQTLLDDAPTVSSVLAGSIARPRCGFSSFLAGSSCGVHYSVPTPKTSWLHHRHQVDIDGSALRSWPHGPSQKKMRVFLDTGRPLQTGFTSQVGDRASGGHSDHDSQVGDRDRESSTIEERHVDHHGSSPPDTVQPLEETEKHPVRKDKLEEVDVDESRTSSVPQREEEDAKLERDEAHREKGLEAERHEERPVNHVDSGQVTPQVREHDSDGVEEVDTLKDKVREHEPERVGEEVDPLKDKVETSAHHGTSAELDSHIPEEASPLATTKQVGHEGSSDLVNEVDEHREQQVGDSPQLGSDHVRQVEEPLDASLQERPIPREEEQLHGTTLEHERSGLTEPELVQEQEHLHSPSTVSTGHGESQAESTLDAEARLRQQEELPSSDLEAERLKQDKLLHEPTLEPEARARLSQEEELETERLKREELLHEGGSTLDPEAQARLSHEEELHGSDLELEKAKLQQPSPLVQTDVQNHGELSREQLESELYRSKEQVLEERSKTLDERELALQEQELDLQRRALEQTKDSQVEHTPQLTPALTESQTSQAVSPLEGARLQQEEHVGSSSLSSTSPVVEEQVLQQEQLEHDLHGSPVLEEELAQKRAEHELNGSPPSASPVLEEEQLLQEERASTSPVLEKELHEHDHSLTSPSPLQEDELHNGSSNDLTSASDLQSGELSGTSANLHGSDGVEQSLDHSPKAKKEALEEVSTLEAEEARQRQSIQHTEDELADAQQDRLKLDEHRVNALETESAQLTPTPKEREKVAEIEREEDHTLEEVADTEQHLAQEQHNLAKIQEEEARALSHEVGDVPSSQKAVVEQQVRDETTEALVEERQAIEETQLAKGAQREGEVLHREESLDSHGPHSAQVGSTAELEDSAQERIDPADNQAVTFEQYKIAHKDKGLDDAQLKKEWEEFELKPVGSTDVEEGDVGDGGHHATTTTQAQDTDLGSNSGHAHGVSDVEARRIAEHAEQEARNASQMAEHATTKAEHATTRADEAQVQAKALKEKTETLQKEVSETPRERDESDVSPVQGPDEVSESHDSQQNSTVQSPPSKATTDEPVTTDHGSTDHGSRDHEEEHQRVSPSPSPSGSDTDRGDSVESVEPDPQQLKKEKEMQPSGSPSTSEHDEERGQNNHSADVDEPVVDTTSKSPKDTPQHSDSHEGSAREEQHVQQEEQNNDGQSNNNNNNGEEVTPSVSEPDSSHSPPSTTQEPVLEEQDHLTKDKNTTGVTPPIEPEPDHADHAQSHGEHTVEETPKKRELTEDEKQMCKKIEDWKAGPQEGDEPEEPKDVKCDGTVKDKATIILKDVEQVEKRTAELAQEVEDETPQGVVGQLEHRAEDVLEDAHIIKAEVPKFKPISEAGFFCGGAFEATDGYPQVRKKLLEGSQPTVEDCATAVAKDGREDCTGDRQLCCSPKFYYDDTGDEKACRCVVNQGGECDKRPAPAGHEKALIYELEGTGLAAEQETAHDLGQDLKRVEHDLGETREGSHSTHESLPLESADTQTLLAKDLKALRKATGWDE